MGLVSVLVSFGCAPAPLFTRPALNPLGTEKGERPTEVRRLLGGSPRLVTPEQAPDSVRDIPANRVSHVCVTLRHGGVGPAHQAHHGLFADAEQEKNCRGGMACVVQASVADAGVLEQPLPLPPVGPGVKRSTGRRGEQPVPVFPDLPRLQTLLVLLGAVFLEQIGQRVRQADIPASCA